MRNERRNYEEFCIVGEFEVTRLQIPESKATLTLTNERRDGGTDGWTDGRTYVRADGRTEELADEWTEG